MKICVIFLRSDSKEQNVCINFGFKFDKTVSETQDVNEQLLGKVLYRSTNVQVVFKVQRLTSMEGKHCG
jgi:hypothetical protein